MVTMFLSLKGVFYMTDKLLRRKAAKIGYKISKGFCRYHDGTIWRDAWGEKRTGYTIYEIDDYGNHNFIDGYDLGTYNLLTDCQVESFLRNKYQQLGLEF